MKKFWDVIFLALPPAVCLFVTLILASAEYEINSTYSQWIIYASILSFLGVPGIVFSDQFARLNARIHSFWHPIEFEEEKKAEFVPVEDETDGCREPEFEKCDGDVRTRRKYKPTKLNYRLTRIGGFIVYGVGIVMYLILLTFLRQ